MSNLTHLFKVDQKVRYYSDDLKRFYKGTVKEVYEDHLIVNVPELSDHLWFEEGFNIDRLYPEYNFSDWKVIFQDKRKGDKYGKNESNGN